MNLVDKFNNINKPNSENLKLFKVTPLTENSIHYLGKNSENHFAILFNTVKPAGKSDGLKYIKLSHNEECLIQNQNDKEVNETFSVLKFTSNSDDLRVVFIKMLANIINDVPIKPSQKDISDITKVMFDVFVNMQKTSESELIGLWGELLVIDLAYDKTKIIKAWHEENTDNFDFHYANELLEIKTTTTNDRIHNFTFKQLNIKHRDFYLASIRLQYSRSGFSLEDLLEKILVNVSDLDLKKKLETNYYSITGNFIKDILDNYKFDYLFAKENIKFFNLDNIPRLKETPMNGVENIKFTSDLNGVENLEDLKKTEILKNFID
jgi:hypothetical protein